VARGGGALARHRGGAGSSLHWFELGTALRELHRVLRRGGRFAFGWNHRDSSRPASRGWASWSTPRGPPGEAGWRGRDWGAAVTEGGLFGEIAALLDADPEIRRGDRLALPFVVDAHRVVAKS
jgi:SAM-dependent methyltransferase